MVKLVHLIALVMLWTSGEFIKNEIPESTMELYKNLHNHCEQQTKVVDLDKHIQEFNSGQHIENKEFYCYIKCMMVEINVYNDITHEINLTPLEILESKDFIDSIREQVYECFDTHKDISDICERIYTLYKCCNQFDPENIIML